MGKASDDERFSFERRVEEHLNSRKKSIDVNVDNTSPSHFSNLFWYVGLFTAYTLLFAVGSSVGA
jgi:hypothetical protein